MKIKLYSIKNLKKLFENYEDQKKEIFKKWGLGTETKYGQYSAKAIYGQDLNKMLSSGPMMQEDGMSKPCPDIVWSQVPPLVSIYPNYVGKQYPLKEWLYTVDQIMGIKASDLDWNPIVKIYRRNLEVLFVYHPEVGTMATDGITLFINPVFFQFLLDQCGGKSTAMFFVIIHEIYHVLLRHVYRAYLGKIDPRDPYNNISADYEVNTSIIEDLGSPSKIVGKIDNWTYDFVKKVIGGYINPDYAHKSFEEIYRLVKKNAEDNQEQMQTPPEEKWSPEKIEAIKKGAEAAIEEIREAIAQGKI